MLRALRHHWRDPGFWRWWWNDVVSREARIALAVALALAAAGAGYLSAGTLANASRSADGGGVSVVTIERTVVERVVRERNVPLTQSRTERMTLPAVTRTVASTSPGETVTRPVTLMQSGPDRLVERTQTVVRAQTITRPVTQVRVPTAPPQTVVRDVPGPTQTVVRDRTTPPLTVTVVSIQTAVVTTTRTEIQTETLPPSTATVTVTAPKPK